VSTPVCLDLIPSLPFLSRSLKLFSAEQSGGGSGYRWRRRRHRHQVGPRLTKSQPLFIDGGASRTGYPTSAALHARAIYRRQRYGAALAFKLETIAIILVYNTWAWDNHSPSSRHPGCLAVSSKV
jgi:hypothetical protein